MATTPKNTNGKGKGKAQAASASEAQAATAESSTVETSTNIATLLPTLPTLAQAKKSMRKSFAELILKPFAVFDKFSMEYISMKNRLSENRANKVPETLGLNEFQVDLYNVLTLSANSLDLDKLERTVATRDVKTLFVVSDEYQNRRATDYENDLKAGKKTREDGTIIPFYEFKGWTLNYMQDTILRAVTKPKKAKAK